MLFNRNAAKILAAVLIGAGLHHVIQSHLSSKKKIEPYSNALCFLDPKYQSLPLAQIDGKKITKDAVPPDLYASYIYAESEAFKIFRQITREIAARVKRSEAASQNKDPLKASELKPIETVAIPDQIAKDYFEANKGSFSGLKYEQVASLIKELLQKKENEARLKSEMDLLESNKRFEILAPMPCGGKVEIPYSNALPANGNTTVNFNVLYAFNYDCTMCRQEIYELKQFLAENMSQMRLWLMPIPGKKGTRTHHYAAALQCSHTLNSAKLMDFHLDILTNPSASEKDKDGNYEVLKVAEKHGYKADTFKKCLESASTEAELKKYQDFADRFKFDGTNPQYFLNERGMETLDEKNFVARLKFMLEEQDKLNR